ncbi:MAG: Dabb family protein [Eubacterium sp.]|jgi:hypothetical protein|nr:Dabb family protein [Eubacterium sp.]
MVRHIVIWNFKDGFSDAENKENALIVKTELEALPGLIDGIVKLDVHIDALPGSNRDVILNSLFESAEALNAYQIHPEHKRVGQIVRAVLDNRACMDYAEDL